MTTPLYDDSNWRSEYIDIKSRQLSSRQIQLLESGADSLASSWFLQAMYNDWKKIKGFNKLDPKENVGQLQSSLSDFFKKSKRSRYLMTEFISRHIGINETEQTQMLEDLGLSSLDELVRQIVPDSILLRGDYKLPDGCSGR